MVLKSTSSRIDRYRLHASGDESDIRSAPNRLDVQLPAHESLCGGNRGRQVCRLIAPMERKKHIFIDLFGTLDGQQPASYAPVGA